MQQQLQYDLKVLFGKIATGDTNAFKKLFDRYKNRLYAVVLKLTKSPAATEDIVQEVFTAMWESRLNLKNVNHPQAYIYTIAYNKAYRYLKIVAADDHLCQALRRQMKTTHHETEEWMQANETRNLIDQAIQKLPSQRQLIYKLSREIGLSHKQIAEQLHISPLTVKKQIVLALRHIRSSLTQIAPALLFFLFLH